MTIAETFAQLRARGEMGLIAYLTAGYPSLPAFVEALQTVSSSGADVVEVGLPFSDPMADGPTIQFASHEALLAGARFDAILAVLGGVKLRQPLVLMSYLNPLLAKGDSLLPRLREAGISGLIIPDLPAEEAADWAERTRRAGLSLILLAAPTSPPERLKRIGEVSDGFVYAVSLTGITGARAELSDALPDFLHRLREATRKPIAVGFGIARPEQVASLRGQADAVVVGSRLVDAIRKGEDLGAIVRELKAATKWAG